MKTQIKIISSNIVGSFEKQINELLNEGWELRGQMVVNSVPYHGVDHFYSQMMIKYPNTEVKQMKFPFNLIDKPDHLRPTQIY